MKKTIQLFVMVAAFHPVFAGQGLVVTQNYSEAKSGSAGVKVTWYVTESQCKMKMEFKDEKVNTVSWFIPDTKTSFLLTYNEGPVPAGAQKSFFTIPVSGIKGEATTGITLSISRSGETKTISGMLCEKLMVKSEKGVTEMWVTKDFKAAYYKFLPFFKNSLELMALNQENLGGFPLASVTKDFSGNVVNSFEVVAADLKDLQESDFKVPSDYVSASELSKAKK